MHFPLYCDSRGSSINSGTVNTFIYYELKDLVGFLTYECADIYDCTLEDIHNVSTINM